MPAEVTTRLGILVEIVRACKARGGEMPRLAWLYRPLWQALRRDFREDMRHDSDDVGPPHGHVGPTVIPALLVAGVPIFPRDVPEPDLDLVFGGDEDLLDSWRLYAR